MVNDSKSGNSLNGFVEKIDFTELNGTPEDFYKAGLAFIENGQFDDGIQEFVKVVKTASIDSPSFGQAVKELKNMGFTGADISAITNISESEINLKFEYIATYAASNLPREKNPFSNKFAKFFFGGWLIIFLGFVALTIISYLFDFLANRSNGFGTNLGFSFAFIIGLFLFYALVIYIFIYYVVSIIRSMKKNRSILQRDEEKPTQVIGEVSAEIKNNKITAYLVVAFGLVVFIAFLAQFIWLYFFEDLYR